MATIVFDDTLPKDVIDCFYIELLGVLTYSLGSEGIKITNKGAVLFIKDIITEKQDHLLTIVDLSKLISININSGRF